MALVYQILHQQVHILEYAVEGFRGHHYDVFAMRGDEDAQLFRESSKGLQVAGRDGFAEVVGLVFFDLMADGSLFLAHFGLEFGEGGRVLPSIHLHYSIL